MHRKLRSLTVGAVLALALVGCTEANSSSTNQDPTVSRKAEAALAKLEGKVLSKGPYGEEPAPASAAQLTAEQVSRVKAKDATAAIVMHYGGNDWATAQVRGLKSEFSRLGIKVIAVTDADFDPAQQVSDLETVLAKNPDIIVSIPTDPVATASAYQAAARSGAKLVFMDNVPQGLKPGRDYVSVVSADNYGNGVVSAHLMAKALGGQGEIGVIDYESDFFVTNQRYQGFKDSITSQYPRIDIVEETGIAGPDFAGDAQTAADAMLTQHPNLAGIWAVWDVPADGVMASARAAGRLDLAIATEDLGKNAAIALAEDELVVGLGAQVPFEQGVTEARLAAGALLGEKQPPYVALSAFPVTHQNVLKAWTEVYHQPPPAFLRNSYEN